MDNEYLVRFAAIDEVDALITDAKLPGNKATELRAAGLVEANRYVELGIFSEYRARKPV